MTAQNLTISSGQEVPVYIDFADLAQTGYNLQQEIAEEMGDLLNEYVEAQLLAQHGSFTDVGDSAGTITSGVTGAITVSASNVDDIIRGVKRIIRVANGQSKMRNQGAFIVWRPADFELLEAKPDVGLLKSFLIDSEIQKWTTRAKEFISTLNDLAKGILSPQLGYAKVCPLP